MRIAELNWRVGLRTRGDHDCTGLQVLTVAEMCLETSHQSADRLYTRLQVDLHTAMEQIVGFGLHQVLGVKARWGDLLQVVKQPSKLVLLFDQVCFESLPGQGGSCRHPGQAATDDQDALFHR